MRCGCLSQRPGQPDPRRPAVLRDGLLLVLIPNGIRVFVVEEIPNPAEELPGASERLDDSWTLTVAAPGTLAANVNPRDPHGQVALPSC